MNVAVPLFDLSAFRYAGRRGEAVVFRPTVRVLLQSLPVFAAEIVACLILVYVGMRSIHAIERRLVGEASGGEAVRKAAQPDEQLAEVRRLSGQILNELPADRRQQVLKAVAEERARFRMELRQERVRGLRKLSMLVWLPLGAVVFLHGGALLLRFLLGGASFSVDDQQRLVFAHGIGRWRRHRWPLSEFSHWVVYASPRRRALPLAGPIGSAWTWKVALSSASAEQVGLRHVAVGPTFIVGGQPVRPREDEAIRGELAAIVTALSKLTGLPVSKPLVASSPSAGDVGCRATWQQSVVEELRATSPESLPPELQAEAKRLLAEAERSGGRSARVYVVTDFTGRQRTYRSIDEMPPEVRAIFDQSARRKEPDRSDE